jgi:hypothetical protein
MSGRGFKTMAAPGNRIRTKAEGGERNRPAEARACSQLMTNRQCAFPAMAGLEECIGL